MATTDPALRSFIDQLPDAVFLVEPDWTVAVVSSAAAELLGHATASLAGASWLESICEQARTPVRDAAARLLGGNSVVEPLELGLLDAAGGEVETSATLRVWSWQGQRWLLCSARETGTERRRTERLEQSNELLDGMLQATRELVSLTDMASGRLVQVNQAWLRAAGYEREEVLGRSAEELGIWGDSGNRERVAEYVRNAGGRVEDYDIVTYSRDGKPLRLRVNVSPLRSREGPMILMVGTDLTEQYLTQEKLRQAQRMEAVGQLTGGVAHDFNNLLGIILGNAEMLKEDLAGDPELSEFVEFILGAAERGAGVTRQLLAFARKQALVPRAVNVEEAIRSMLTLLRSTLGPNIRVEVSCEPGLPPALVDKGEFETSMLNLVVNARDAMPSGGVLRVRVEMITVTADEFDAGEAVAAGNYLGITVQDTGVGMDAEILNHVFEPFFTTKPVGRGTGLGLSMVFGFVRQSGGQVRARSIPGEGTAITLLLPPTESEAAQRASPSAISGARGETVLVLDDEPSILRMASSMLRRLGYGVLTARDEAELRTLLDAQAAFEVLLSDVLLSGPRNGHELAAEVLVERPAVQVVFMTGFADRQLEALPGQRLRVLDKPFGMEELGRLLREALDD